MKNIIYISKSISGLLDYSPQKYNDIIIFNDFDKELKKLVKLKKDVVKIIIFLTFNELLKIKEMLDNARNEVAHLVYRIILIETSLTEISRKILFANNIIDLRTSRISSMEFDFLIDRALYEMKVYNDNDSNETNFAELKDAYQDQQVLISIGKRLTGAEKDQSELLKTILLLSKKITGADGGTIYLVEEEKGKKYLRFKYSHTYSKELAYEESSMLLNKNSIAGHVALTGDVLNINDVYHIPSKKYPDLKHNYSYDKKNGYLSKSMLSVPMRNHNDHIIGVIQLINCKENYASGIDAGNEAFTVKLDTQDDFKNKVFPFDSRYENLMQAVASQAAIAIENIRMIKKIQSQLEEFVRASVGTIEARDPSTSGHSLRVANMSVEIAKAVNETNSGALKNITFSKVQIKELEYAALLHDFGKVNIDFTIFLKAKKLFPKDFTFLQLKLDYLYQYICSKHLEEKSRMLEMLLKDGSSPENQQLVIDELDLKLKKIDDLKSMVGRLNEPHIQNTNPDELISTVLNEIKNFECCDPHGRKINILDDNEILNLSIKKGSLNPDEIKEIESHVMHSYEFVKKIPWPQELKNIPEFVYKHHEKLDGSGYPQKLKSKDIPLQARIITVVDIYDALTASDRPYKSALSHEKAVSILKEEAENDKIDMDILNVFIKNNIHEKKSLMDLKN